MDNLNTESFVAHDSVLDCPIVPEEVAQAISHLKSKSSGGADLLSPNHLKHSGVFNTIASLEQIPLSFKFGLITPVYKGKGKDPVTVVLP